MSHALMLTMQNYCLALRQELGYPAFLPVDDTLKFGSGGAVDGLKAFELARHVVAMGRDLVYTAWTKPLARSRLASHSCCASRPTST